MTVSPSMGDIDAAVSLLNGHEKPQPRLLQGMFSASLTSIGSVCLVLLACFVDYAKDQSDAKVNQHYSWFLHVSASEGSVQLCAPDLVFTVRSDPCHQLFPSQNHLNPML